MSLATDLSPPGSVPRSSTAIGLLTCWQPTPAVQLSVVRGLPSSQVPPAAQAPATQASVGVHGLPSSQATPSVFAGFEQVPSVGLQDPALWHWSAAAQTTGFAPAHVPLWHVSV